MNLKQWTSVFQSLQLLNGEYIHGKNQAIFKASKPGNELPRHINLAKGRAIDRDL